MLKQLYWFLTVCWVFELYGCVPLVVVLLQWLMLSPLYLLIVVVVVMMTTGDEQSTFLAFPVLFDFVGLVVVTTVCKSLVVPFFFFPAA